uniref:MAP7 domain containing 3 n=1 Tax=Mustela putorius furo TaxID=9669 RepID=M3XS72_MUSPF
AAAWKMAERAGGGTSLRGMRERMVAAAHAIAEERRNQSSFSTHPSQSANIRSAFKPVIDGSVLKNDVKQRLAKERREETKRQQEATKETQLLEKERKSRIQYEKQMEEKQRKLKEQKEKDEQRRISAEEKRKQKLQEERERFKAVLCRTLERSNRVDHRQKRWSWEGSTAVNPETKTASKRSVSTEKLEQETSGLQKQMSVSSAGLQSSVAKKNIEKKRSSSLTRRSNKLQAPSETVQVEEKPTATRCSHYLYLYIYICMCVCVYIYIALISSTCRLARQSYTSLRESNLITRLLVPTKASIARSKSAASLSVPGKDTSGNRHRVESLKVFVFALINLPPVSYTYRSVNKMLFPPKLAVSSCPRSPTGTHSALIQYINMPLRSHSSDELKNTMALRKAAAAGPPQEKVEAPPDVSVEAAPHVKVEATPEATVEAAPEVTVEAASEAHSGKKKASCSKKSEMDKQASNPATKKRPPSHIPCYKWPSSPASGWRPPSPISINRQMQKNRPPSPSPVMSKQSQSSLSYKVIPVQRSLLAQNALGSLGKKREGVPKAASSAEAVSPKQMVSEESSNKSTPGTMNAKEATKILAEKRRLAREQREREERIQKEREQRQPLEYKPKDAAEKAAEVQREEFSKLEDGQQQKEVKEGSPDPEDPNVLLQKGDAKIKAQEEADKRKKEQERIMLQNLQERLERKKRIEEIMKRTRKTDSNTAKAAEPFVDNTYEEDEADDEDESESDDNSFDDLRPSAFINGMDSSTKLKTHFKNMKKNTPKLVFLDATSGQVRRETKTFFNGDMKNSRQKSAKDPLAQAKGTRSPTKRMTSRAANTRKASETCSTVGPSPKIPSERFQDIPPESPVAFRR